MSYVPLSDAAVPVSSAVGPQGAQTADSGIITLESACRAHLPWEAKLSDCDVN